MKRRIVWLIVGAIAASLFSANVSARNTPCPGKKGGVSHCENGKFVCKDGTISASKKICTKPGNE